MGMVSTRLADQTVEELKRRAGEEDRTVSEIVSRAVEEHLRELAFPGIVFVGGGNGRRRAHLVGGPDVWEVVFMAKDCDMDPDRAAELLDLPIHAVRQALQYYRTYPEEIDARLRQMAEFEENPTLLCPGINVIAIARGADEAAA